MAEAAGIDFGDGMQMVTDDELEAFARAVAADCARMAGGPTTGLYGRDGDIYAQAQRQIAEVIRAKYL
jgi:hypothetical protein